MLCVILGTPGGGTDLEGVGSYNVSDVSHQSDFCSSLPPPPRPHCTQKWCQPHPGFWVCGPRLTLQS